MSSRVLYRVRRGSGEIDFEEFLAAMRKQMAEGHKGGLAGLALTASSFFDLLNPFAWFSGGREGAGGANAAPASPTARAGEPRESGSSQGGEVKARLAKGSPPQAQPQYYHPYWQPARSSPNSPAGRRASPPNLFPSGAAKPSFGYASPATTARSSASSIRSQSVNGGSPMPIRFLMSEAEIKQAQKDGSFNRQRELVKGAQPRYPSYLFSAYTDLECSDAERQTLSA
jgi:hypothetical protein